MDTNKNVIEAHLAGTGKTIPLRQTEAKSGNKYWATLKQNKAGDRKFSSFGVNVPVDLTGNPHKITTIKVEGVGEVKVKHDITEPYFNPQTKKTSKGGKARASAEHIFTSPVDKEKWVLSFRATLVNEDTVNIQASLRRQGGGKGFGPQVQSAL